MNQSSVFQPPDRQRVDERIATTIADAILDGVFPPGSTLPPERDLAERLGVNRTSLRQGLARLQQMGLIEVRHGSGSVVRDPEGLTHPAVVEALVRKLGPDFLVELLEIRAALGPLIGRLAEGGELRWLQRSGVRTINRRRTGEQVYGGKRQRVLIGTPVNVGPRRQFGRRIAGLAGNSEVGQQDPLVASTLTG